MQLLIPVASYSQDFEAFRDNQIELLQDYVIEAIQPSGLVRDSLVLDPNANHFHPATPDAAGFALISLAAFDQHGSMAGADQKVVDILKAYTGNTNGVSPERSTDGHYIHFMDIATGADAPGWDDSYSPIGSALIVSGAQFASNHFQGTNSPLASQIAQLAEELTNSIDFNAAIHPNLNGGIYLDMTSSGGGAGGTVMPWNEYQLVTSLALREDNNDRATAIKHLWLNPENAPQKAFGNFNTLTDNPNNFAPAFWVQQAQFFNGDFRNSTAFQGFLQGHRIADKLYSKNSLGEDIIYGLTAGVSPNGYQADRIMNHPGTVFSPEAVAAWGDMNTLLEFAAEQDPNTNSSYRYGLVRTSQDQPNWIPYDAGLVDHLFLLYGLIESLDQDFFVDRLFAPLLPGDYNFDGMVDAADYTVWRDSDLINLAADGDLDSDVDQDDYLIWKENFGQSNSSSSLLSSSYPVPEPITFTMLLSLMITYFLVDIRQDCSMNRALNS